MKEICKKTKTKTYIYIYILTTVAGNQPSLCISNSLLTKACIKSRRPRPHHCLTQNHKTWNLTYSVKLFCYELDNYFIEKENQDLRQEKRTPEESLTNKITKRQKIEGKLDDTGRSYKYHKKRFQGLVHRIAEMSKRGVMSPEKRSFNEHSK